MQGLRDRRRRDVHDLADGPAAGAVASAGLYVRSASDGGAGVQVPTATVITADDGGFTLDFFNGAGPKIDAEWKIVTAQLTTKQPFAYAELRFGASAPASGYCFVVDDAVLTVTGP